MPGKHGLMIVLLTYGSRGQFGRAMIPGSPKSFRSSLSYASTEMPESLLPDEDRIKRALRNSSSSLPRPRGQAFFRREAGSYSRDRCSLPDEAASEPR